MKLACGKKSFELKWKRKIESCKEKETNSMDWVFVACCCYCCRRFCAIFILNWKYANCAIRWHLIIEEMYKNRIQYSYLDTIYFPCINFKLDCLMFNDEIQIILNWQWIISFFQYWHITTFYQFYCYGKISTELKNLNWILRGLWLFLWGENNNAMIKCLDRSKTHRLCSFLNISTEKLIWFWCLYSLDCWKNCRFFLKKLLKSRSYPRHFMEGLWIVDKMRSVPKRSS